MSTTNTTPGIEVAAAPALPDVVEVCVLLPGWQVSRLDSVARRQGLTSGQLLRRFLDHLLNHLACPADAGAAQRPAAG